jgi:hypothetical protein
MCLEPQQEETSPEVPIEDAEVPEDVRVDLRFPLLIGNRERLLLTCVVDRNKAALITVIDATDGKPVAQGGVKLTMPPPGKEIVEHWRETIQQAANFVLHQIDQQARAGLVVPGKGLVVAGGNGGR